MFLLFSVLGLTKFSHRTGQYDDTKQLLLYTNSIPAYLLKYDKNHRPSISKWLAIRICKAETKETTQIWLDINIFISHALLNFSEKLLLNVNISWHNTESLSSLMSNRRAITALHNNNNKDTKSRAKQTKIADATMKSNPVAEFAHEHYGLEFATHTALCCSARLKTVSWAESVEAVWYPFFILIAAVPLCYLIFNKIVYSALT